MLYITRCFLNLIPTCNQHTNISMCVCGMCSCLCGTYTHRCALIHTGMHVCVKARGQHQMSLSLSIFFYLFYTYFFVLYVYTCMGTQCHDLFVRGQRTTFMNWFSPSTMWAPGIHLRSSGLVGSAFTCSAISLAPLPQTGLHSEPGVCQFGSTHLHTHPSQHWDYWRNTCEKHTLF